MDAQEDDLKLGLTVEFLYEEYIVKDRGLQDLADQFSVGVKKIRGALKRAGIQKAPEQIKNKISRIGKERTALDNNFRHLTPEQRRHGNQKSVESKMVNRLQRLQRDGLTKNYLHQLYIEENRSLKELQELLELNKGALRNLLSLYGIVKTQADRDRARTANLSAFYEIPESVEAMILKRNATVGERYGNSWYRKTTSKEEDGLRDAIAARYPELRIIQSDWSTIRRISNGAQLQLDLLLPDLKIAVEYNGEFYHDRLRYEASLRGECESPELEKSMLCDDLGIELIHVWSSDWRDDPDAILSVVGRTAALLSPA